MCRLSLSGCSLGLVLITEEGSECGSDPDTCVMVTAARPPTTGSTLRRISGIHIGSLKEQDEEEPDKTGAVSLSDVIVDDITVCLRDL